MAIIEVATTATAALLRSGLARPPASPVALARMARAVATRGGNTAVLLAVAAARWPDRAAIIDDDGEISYRELARRTAALERTLYHRHRIRVGQPVCVMSRNGAGFVTAALAATGVGADVVLLNADFNTAALTAALAQHQPRVVLCDREFHQQLHTVDPTLTLIDPTDLADAPAATIPANRAAGRLVLLTSGTTGSPKGVPRAPSPTQVLGVTATILRRTGLRTGTRMAIAVPFFHAFGFAMLILTLALGGTVITSRRFRAEDTLAQLAAHRADALAVVPIMLNRILELAEPVRARYPVPALRVVVAGGAPLEPALGQRFMDGYGEVLYNGYGSSEVGIGSFATPQDLRRAPDTVGRPVAGSPVRILDADDRPLPAGVVGRIFVGGPLTFAGYTGGAGKPVVAGTTGTGDLGYLDEHGCLYIVGREDDMIVSGGENVYPQAVANVLGAHPDIADNAVLGVPDPEYGQRLAAFVVARPGAVLTEAAVRDHLKGRVARYEQPRDIRFVEEIPRNTTGKILHRELRTAKDGDDRG